MSPCLNKHPIECLPCVAFVLSQPFHSSYTYLQVAIPPITHTVEELKAMSIKELKGLLSERGLSCPSGVEKGELAAHVHEKTSNVTYYR